METELAFGLVHRSKLARRAVLDVLDAILFANTVCIGCPIAYRDYVWNDVGGADALKSIVQGCCRASVTDYLRNADSSRILRSSNPTIRSLACCSLSMNSVRGGPKPDKSNSPESISLVSNVRCSS